MPIRKVPTRMAKAQAAHDKFLRSLGVDPAKKPKLRGAVAHPLHASGAKRDVVLIPTSDIVPGSGKALRPSPKCDLPVAQVYHKGPLMVVTDMKSLDGSKRRS